MLYHRAFGRDLDTVIVAVIDNRKSMLSLMRGMLAAIGIARIDTYTSPVEAYEAMAKESPDLVIAAAFMQPLTGPELVRAMRNPRSGELALIPAMILSACADPARVEEALKAGAHQVLVLPISARTLYRRIDWLINDDRPFELKGEHYVVAGLEQRLSINVQQTIYVPPEPGLPFLAGAPEEDPALTLDVIMKARAAPH